MTKRKKYLLIVAGLVGGFAICTQLFGYQAYFIYKARSMYSRSEMPEMYITPEALPSTTCLPPKTTFTNYGFRFSVPWNDLEMIHEREPLSLYRFSNGKGVVIEAEGDVSLLEPLLKEWQGQQRQGYESLFGADNIQSAYSLLYACLNTTPDALSLFENKRISSGKLIFLIPKSVVVNRNSEKIYSFKFDNCKGFQIGTASSDTRIKIICFTDDNTSTSIRISGGTEHKLNQEEINCIIKSLEKIESEPTT